MRGKLFFIFSPKTARGKKRLSELSIAKKRVSIRGGAESRDLLSGHYMSFGISMR